MTSHYAIDPERLKRNQRRNKIHAAVLIGALAALMAVVGWFMAGPAGLFLIAFFAIITLSIGPNAARRLMLQLYSATPLKRHKVPVLYDMVEEFSRRGGVTQTVTLYYIPSRLMLAFTVGGKDDVSMAVSDGLLRRLSGREIAGVLAHELSHVAHGDLMLMALADFITKVTRSLALIALLLIAINLPFIMEGDIAIPWPPIVLLAVAPLLSLLLQLGLSRAREYDADTGAALMTGDPEGIASALQKMDAQQRNWEMALGRIGTGDQPSILRTHPPTAARIRALGDIVTEADPPDVPPDIAGDVTLPGDGAVSKKPRRRFHGFKY